MLPTCIILDGGSVVCSIFHFIPIQHKVIPVQIAKQFKVSQRMIFPEIKEFFKNGCFYGFFCRLKAGPSCFRVGNKVR
jgi:hypothetical protein